MSDLPVLVLRTAGINCDEEVVHAWQKAGAKPTLLHVNAVADKPSMLEDFRIVTIPGGFSYGDDIAAGTILAQRIMQDLLQPMKELVERGGGILGICNGFQVLVKTGLLPGGDAGRDKVTVTFNDSAKFEARWVRLEVGTDHCPFLTPAEDRGQQEYLEMPVEHAEGKVVTASEAVLDKLGHAGQIAVRYVDGDGSYDRYPANPNGSVGGIAGLCDPTGRIFGLMPHPDRHFEHTHHPQWTRRNPQGPPNGLTVFQNAVRYWRG
ncbi:MAG: phosphoribosylformylglycinamidine synthase I [Phycisphaerales bacterium]|nr:MAG: phosphoribosylformylglycinamidine synthase I [Phycisphaerales bacterium]